ncbi:hypothetical protein H9P43_009711 [Blastocladiella emersonii ATCC 22665]|nr:hypothetical protein H9P43_009711 [Blastocladiella emersonii ATCC 22665]
MTMTEHMNEQLPLHGVLVVEMAGLAPVPFVGMILADLGASVLRVDRPAGKADALSADFLTRGKSAVELDLKSPTGLARLRSLIARADVLLDPYRPGVIESLLKVDSAESVLATLNPRLVFARLVGFPRDGDRAKMAGHDINYLAVSGVLSLLGRSGDKPTFPVNLAADFAGGSLMCVIGILAALLRRGATGSGSVVDVNMVQGVQYLASFLRGFHANGMLGARGENLLDSGAHMYDTYETADGQYVALGSLEPQFYAEFLRILAARNLATPAEIARLRAGTMFSDWPAKKTLLTAIVKRHPRATWAAAYDGSDACLTPVLGMDEVDRWPKFNGSRFEPVPEKWNPVDDVLAWDAVARRFKL